MATADFLDQKRNEIEARLKELRPLVDEYARLEAAASALDRAAATASNSVKAGRAVRRAQTPARKHSASSGRRGRPKGSGMRAAEALAVVRRTPGLAIPAIAEKMGIRQNYLYRVLPNLAAQGLVVKEGRGWKATEAA